MIKWLLNLFQTVPADKVTIKKGAYVPTFSQRLFRYLQREKKYSVRVAVLLRRPFANDDTLTIRARSKWQAERIAQKYLIDKVIVCKVDKITTLKGVDRFENGKNTKA